MKCVFRSHRGGKIHYYRTFSHPGMAFSALLRSGGPASQAEFASIIEAAPTDRPAVTLSIRQPSRRILQRACLPCCLTTAVLTGVRERQNVTTVRLPSMARPIPASVMTIRKGKAIALPVSRAECSG